MQSSTSNRSSNDAKKMSRHHSIAQDVLTKLIFEIEWTEKLEKLKLLRAKLNSCDDEENSKIWSHRLNKIQV